MLAPVHQAVVDLVRVHEQVVPLRELGDALDVARLEHPAGRVVREAQQDRPRPRGDRALDVLGPKPEVVCFVRRHRDRDGASQDDARHVRDVAGIGEDDLVALVERRAHREIDGFGDADRDEDLAGGVVPDAAEPRGVLADRLAQLEDAVVRGVLRAALADRADRRLAEALGRHEVGLSDAQRNHAFEAGGEIEVLADPARRDSRDVRVHERSSRRSHAATCSGRAR